MHEAINLSENENRWCPPTRGTILCNALPDVTGIVDNFVNFRRYRSRYVKTDGSRKRSLRTVACSHIPGDASPCVPNLTRSIYQFPEGSSVVLLA